MIFIIFLLPMKAHKGGQSTEKVDMTEIVKEGKHLGILYSIVDL